MTKNEFDTLPTQERLDKINYFLNILHKEKENILQQHYHCDQCKEYFPKNNVKVEEKIETHYECVFTDAGYGDDDRFADVTYSYIYGICPYCGSRNFIKRIYLYSNNERGKYQ